jgi:hypothetical protein
MTGNLEIGDSPLAILPYRVFSEHFVTGNDDSGDDLTPVVVRNAYYGDFVQTRTLT